MYKARRATEIVEGHFKEDFGFSAAHIRFTQSGEGVLYAIALGAPEEREMHIKSLGKSALKVERVQLLGHAGDHLFSQSDDFLSTTLPDGNLINIASCL